MIVTLIIAIRMIKVTKCKRPHLTFYAPKRLMEYLCSDDGVLSAAKYPCVIGSPLHAYTFWYVMIFEVLPILTLLYVGFHL